MAAAPRPPGPAGQFAADSVVRLREARGWDQSELACRLSEFGGRWSQPIVSRVEAGSRRLDADDLVALAVVLGVSVVALLPPVDTGEPPAPVPLFVVDGDVGSVEAALTEDIGALGDLSGVEPTLAAVGYRLARQMDGHRRVSCEECGASVEVPADPRILPQLARELRATVATLVEGRVVDDDDDGLGDLGEV